MLRVRLPPPGDGGAAALDYVPPLGGGAALAGLTPEEARVRVARLFAVCGAGQATAVAAACDAAAGRPWPPRAATEAQHLEWMREHARALLLDWPLRLGLAPDLETVRAVRHAPGGDALAALLQARLGLEEVLVRGDWPRRGPLGELARCLASVDVPLAAAAMWPQPGRSEVERRLGDAVPAESGALARQRSVAGIERALADPQGGVRVRLLARTVELGRLAFEGPWSGAVTSWQLAPGRGAAAVETARGLLVHEAEVRDGRIVRYRMVSPTAGNFHPDGAVAAALRGLRGGVAAVRAVAERLVAALDPCVPFTVEFG